MGRLLRSFSADESAAVAPLYALAFIGLIGIGGVGFDYARLMTLDSELQNAADQAALAAATQLDGRAGAMERARDAARLYFANETIIANDGGEHNVSIDDSGFKFYPGSCDPDTIESCTEAEDDEDAAIVRVTVNAREVFYALTPIVGALSSGDVIGDAVAGLRSSVCKIPPLMICNPNEAAGGVFPSSADRGKGLKLEAGGGGAWTPGNYGYLDFGGGAKDLAEALGANSSLEDCISLDDLSTKTGNNASVTKALNTRFDVYENGLTSYCAAGTGNCSPAMNTRKDLVHPAFGAGTNNCAFQNGNDPWDLPTDPYLGISTPVPKNMGLPRDICHAASSAGSCSGGRFGNGSWDRDLYFSVNHNGTSATAAQTWAGRSTLAELSRYDVYRWELATSGMLGDRVAETRQKLNPQGKPVGQPTTYYSYSGPKCASGKPETSVQKDRRVLTVAVVNCTANNIGGHSDINNIEDWVDVFLVEPSVARTYTSADQIYVEIIGTAEKPLGGQAFQYYGRNKPVLLR